MIRTFAIKILAVLLLNISIGSQAFAQTEDTGLSSRLATEVRLDLWATGLEENFKSSYQHYQEILEVEMAQEVAPQNDENTQIAQLPEELEIALFSFN